MTAQSTNRPLPGGGRRRSCMDPNSSACAANHPGWRHAESVDEVIAMLDQDYWVADQDGDPVMKATAYSNANDPDIDIKVILDGGGEYHYKVQTILVEDVLLVEPASEEEVDEAMASILAAFKANRLT